MKTIGRISGLPVNGRPVLRPSADWASVDQLTWQATRGAFAAS